MRKKHFHWLLKLLSSSALTVLSVHSIAQCNDDDDYTDGVKLLCAGEFVNTIWRSSGGNYDFVGYHTREFYEDRLNVTIESTNGGFDTGVANNISLTPLRDMHENARIEGRLSIIGDASGGSWWYGPKISINWDSSGGVWEGTRGWYENYIVDRASRSPAELEQWILNDYESFNPRDAYIGTTNHDGSDYKHYVKYFSTWVQYWAVRQTPRTGGATSIKPILDLWAAHDAQNSEREAHDGDLGSLKMDGVKLNIETSGDLDLQFAICDFKLTGDWSVDSSEAYPEESSEQACSGAVGLIDTAITYPNNLSKSELESQGILDVDEALMSFYVQNIAAYSEYSKPVLLDEVQSRIADVNTLRDTDSDGDEIFELFDECSGTSAGLEVDTKGCVTVASIVNNSFSPPMNIYGVEDLNDIGNVNVKAENMAGYEKAIAEAQPAPSTASELASIVDSVNSLSEIAPMTNSSSNSSASGGGSLSIILLTFIGGLLVFRRRCRFELKNLQ